MLNNSNTQTITVTENQTAQHVGSGGLPVFATPSLIALMESTAMNMLTELPEGKTSVGTEISIKHLKASAVGAKVHCTASIIGIEGRKYSFEVKAFDDNGFVLGEGTHERFVVDIEKFMGKL